MKQANFGFFGKMNKKFGGSLTIGKRKSMRPLSTKHPLQLVLKSTGNKYFAPDSRDIEALIRSHASKYNINLLKTSFNWSHIHFAIVIPTRDAYKRFIRTLTSAMVKYLSKKYGKNLKGLFDLLPFTEILSWGRQLRIIFEYFEKNDMEARGMYSLKKKAKAPG